MMKQDQTVIRSKHGGILRTIVIGAIVLLQCVLSAGEAYAQTAKMTINKDNVTINEVLSAIKAQTALSVVFEASDVNLERKVNIHATDKDVSSVLDMLFQGTDVKYQINDKHIVLSKKVAANSAATTDAGTITGTVKDAAGVPLIGVTVMIKGTSKGTTTGVDGGYSLNAAPGSQLVFSYIGYGEKEVAVANNTSVVNVNLAEDVTTLEKVVVTALGIKRKSKALSYTVSEVNSSDVTTVKDPNFINSLSGKVAGLVINTSSSGVGGAAKVQMRGARSITKSNNALYVIDGVPMFDAGGSGQSGILKAAPSSAGIADINPEDIESMSVLSGAAASALYGSNAGNGVILITTKKGEAGKTKVTLSHNTDFMSPFVTPKFQNRYGNIPGEFGSWGSKLETPSTYDPMDFFQTGYNTTTAVTLSTGTERNQSFISVASTEAEGIVPNNEYSRYNFTVRNTSNFFKEKMTLDFGASYIKQKDQNMVSQGRYYNPIIPIYLFPRGDNFDNVKLYERFDEGRNIPTQYWPYGDLDMSVQNPYWIINRNMHNADKDRLMANVSLKYQIQPWLNIIGRARIDNTYTNQEQKLYAGTNQLFAGAKGQYRTVKDNTRQTYGDVMVNFDKSFCDFNVTATVGTSIFDITNDQDGIYGALAKYVNMFNTRNIDLSARNSSLIDMGYHDQTQSIFASAEVSYKGIAYLTATARNDWDSRLGGSSNQSFFYPSVGASVILSEIIPMPKWFSFAKIRGSYSQVGIPPDRYLTIPTWNWMDDILDTTAEFPVGDLKAETTKSYEAGLDLRFLRNKLDLSVTYYKSNTYNQTFRAEVSPSTGYNSVIVQTGNIENEGLEVSLGYNQLFNNGLRWASQYTFSTNRNKIIDLVSNFRNPLTGDLLNIDELNMKGAGSYNMILKTGGSIGDIYTDQRLLTDSRGNIYVDPSTNKLSSDPSNEQVKIGCTSPKANMGLRNNLSYKGINLGILFTARLGGEVVSATQAIMDRYGVSETSAAARDNGGIPINLGKVDAQHYYELIGGGESGFAGYYTYSATNIRLQELSLGYTLPNKWFKDKLGVTVSAIGKNLWMIYNKAPFDPELAASTGTFYQGFDYFMAPSMRNIGFSVKFTF